MTETIAVTILTGFLGSGKTTLLNRLLIEPELADTAVVINEFGDVSIDHLLVEQANDGVIELSDGCVCCTVRGELVDTLVDLARRVETGRISRLKRVVIETTGLADPAPVLQSLMAHPLLLHAYRLDGIVVTVDAVNGAATLDRHDEAVRQVAMADRVVITKTDLPEAAPAMAALRERLTRLNPGAPILDIAQGLPPSALLDCGLYDPARKIPDVDRWLRDAAPSHPRPHGHPGHVHGAHRHDDRIRTFSLVHDGPVSIGAIETFIDILSSTHGDRLLRMKGIIELVEEPEHPLVLHGVQKIFQTPTRLAAWPDARRGTRLVLITMDMPEDYVHRLFAGITGTPMVDTPDRTAIEENPLAIAGVRL